MSTGLLALSGSEIKTLDDSSFAVSLELLVGLSVPAPKHPPLVSTIGRLIEVGQVSNQQVAALADWWAMVAMGVRSRGLAWSLPPEMPPELLQVLETIRNHAADDDDIPVLIRMVKRREFRDAVDGLAKSLEYSETDTSKFAGEQYAWDDLVDGLRRALEPLRTGRPGVETPEIDDGIGRRVMRKYEIKMGSPRWKYFLRRVEDVRQCRDLVAARYAGIVDLPKSPDIAMERIHLPEAGDGLDRALAAVLRPLIPRSSGDSALIAALLETASTDATPLQRDWLVCLAAPWFKATDYSLSDLSGPLQRYDHAMGQIERMQSQGLDVDLALLNLDEGNLVEAEGILESLGETRRTEDRRRTLESQIESLQASLRTEADTEFAELRRRLDELRAGLHKFSADRAYDEFHQIGREVESARRGVRLEELNRMRAEFIRLGHRPIAVEIGELLESLQTSQDKTIPEDQITETRLRLDQVREELEDRAKQVREEVRARLTVVPEDLDASARTSIESLLRSSEVASNFDPLTAEAEAQRALELLDRFVVPDWTYAEGEAALISHVTTFIRSSTSFSERDIRRIHVALKTRKFLVLSGLTGSGKSTIARLIAEAFHATIDNRRFVRVAVRPNWVDASDVLGYLNPITNRFEPGWFATLLRACERDPNLPFFCLLDEMNLAPVEQYFADALSAMEEAQISRAPVPVQLYSPGAEPANAELWPNSIPYPANLFIFGTINIDESTRNLSDRVLDRANVIQLSVEIGREHHMKPSQEAPLSRRRVRMREWIRLCAVQGSDRCHDLLVEVAEIFTQMRIGLGLRSHLEMERFLANAVGVLPDDEALDLALLQRAIPKVRGFKRDLEPGLYRLHELAKRSGAERTLSVIDDWIDPEVSGDMYIDGTDARVGLVTSF